MNPSKSVTIVVCIIVGESCLLAINNVFSPSNGTDICMRSSITSPPSLQIRYPDWEPVMADEIKSIIGIEKSMKSRRGK